MNIGNQSRFVCVLTGITLLAACAPNVRLDRPDVALPANFDVPRSKLTAPITEPLDRWWERFGDAQLIDLIDTALSRGTDARTAYFRLAEARAIRDQTQSQRLPTGSLTGGASIRGGEQLQGQDLVGSTATARTLSAGFTPSWELDVFGRLAALGRSADASYAVAAYDYHATRLALAADVATGLFQARGLAVQRRDAAETLRIASELAATSRLGFERGLVAEVDTARLEGDVASARAEVVRIDAALRNTKRSLLVLIGRPNDPVDALEVEARLDAPPIVPATIPANLLVRRPDVLAAAQRVAAASAQVKVDRLSLFPQFTLQGSGSITRTAGVLGGTNALWSLASGLALPILDRPLLLARLRITEAQGQQAVVSYEAAVQAAFRDADNALALVAADAPRLAALERAEERGRFAFDATRRGYRAGLSDLTTLLQAERTWRAARSALTTTHTQALANVVSAFSALGGGWDPAAPATAPGKPNLAMPIGNPASSLQNLDGNP